MTLALAPVRDLRSPNFSPAAKEKALRILNDLFRVKVRMKLAVGIAQTPDPPDPPDPPDLPRVLVTSDTIMNAFPYCSMQVSPIVPSVYKTYRHCAMFLLAIPIAFVRCRNALCRYQSGVTMTGPDFSLMDSRFLPISSLVFSGIGIRSAASILFLLEVEAIAMKAAILAASIIEIQHLMDSLSLAKFLKSRGVVN